MRLIQKRGITINVTKTYDSKERNLTFHKEVFYRLNGRGEFHVISRPEKVMSLVS